MERIALLGGSFDPVHNGHINMARAAIAELNVSKVVFIPLGNPPHKKNITDAVHRYTMLELTLDGEKNMELSDIEIKRQGYTYTIDTLNELFHKKPDTSFYYIIGEDTLDDLETWHEHEKVLSLISFAVVSRKDHNVNGKEIIAYLKNKYNADIVMLKEKGFDVSSEEIREKIKNSENVSGLLPPKVYDYIMENKLYEQR